MTNSRVVLATVLTSITFALLLINLIGGVRVLAAGLTPVFGISAIVLGATAFGVSWRQKSFVIAGLLAASGIIFAIPAMIATDILP